MTNAMPPDRQIRLDLAAEVLARFGHVRFIAQGGSMIPAIYPGDLVTVRSAAPVAIHSGDVVLCLRDGRFWLHRLTRKWLDGSRLVFATQGDALRSEDPPADETQLLGRVTSVIRRGELISLRESNTSCSALLRRSVRNSAFLATSLLRLHALRTRFHGSSPDLFASAPCHSSESVG